MLRRVPLRFSLVFAQVEARLWYQAIVEKFNRGIQGDFSSILSGLAEHCRSVLDIGCGVAGIDVLLYAHYRADNLQLYLSDYQPMSPAIYYGYRLEAAVYNSLSITRSLLTSNGVPNSQINMVPPDELADRLPKGGIDLVVSTLAWGFHFPVEDYLAQVDHALSEKGRIILDIRSGTNGMQALAESFRITDILVDRNRYKRVLAQRY